MSKCAMPSFVAWDPLAHGGVQLVHDTGRPPGGSPLWFSGHSRSPTDYRHLDREAVNSEPRYCHTYRVFLAEYLKEERTAIILLLNRIRDGLWCGTARQLLYWHVIGR